MLPKEYSICIETGNACILACRGVSDTAKACMELCPAEPDCSAARDAFVDKAQYCVTTSQVSIKACKALRELLLAEGFEEHNEALDHCIKILGECIRICEKSIDDCKKGLDCADSCEDALRISDEALQAVDAAIESCEKHEVHFLHIKKY